MTTPEELNVIIDRIVKHQQTETDITVLRQWLSGGGQIVSQHGKYAVNLGQGQEIHIGDRTYVTWNDEATQTLIEFVQKQHPKPIGIPENLPRSGVVEFVGRDNIMSKLYQMLQQGHRVAVSAITGMGGVGKTELALQYALKYQPTYLAGICWLSVRGVDVGTQIVQFGRSLLGLNPPVDVELIEQVRFCWRHWQSGEVLLVFDDVTDYAAIKPYLPPSTAPRFKVLITTRLRLGASVNQLELEVLDESAALALLELLVGSDRIQLERDCAQQLCAQLGYLPLGLELVGRYLDRKSDLSLAEMLERLQDKRLVARALCQTEDDMTARLGVAAAFDLSWETLSESAKLLGYLSSLFAAAPIPWSLLDECLNNQDSETLEEIRDSELLNLHLLQQTSPGTYRLHPLIRDFFQTKSDPRLLEKSEELNLDTLKQKFWQVMAAVAQEITRSSTSQQILTVSPIIIPHLEAASRLENWQLSEDQLMSIIPYRKKNSWITSIFDHPSRYVLEPYMGLGQFYEGQGAYAKAEPWYTQCLWIAQTRLAANHPSLATSLHNLAKLYREQGHLGEAELLFEQSLAVKENQLSADHPQLAASLNSLVFLYRSQERHSEATSLFWQSRAIEICLDNLGVLYVKQGRYTEAEPLLQQSLAIREHLYGTDDPNVAVSLHNLGKLYRDQGRYIEAEPLYQQALAIEEKNLGADHLNVALSLHNLAELYRDQERYSEAEQLFQRSLEIKEKNLEADHPHVAVSLSGLGTLYRLQGCYSEAEPRLQRALDIWKGNLGETHPLVGRGLDNLAMLRAAQGHDGVAEELYLKALEILELGLGSKHPWTLRCRENLEQFQNRSN
ncbi:tetratricopeptide repeat protein [Nostoc sp. ChiQUE01b]|uniref:tetratricopeptide repeat protein n=1 Tax=Nostoc sp. ChiQUE01b TaxID=3075376 RepID=UPI002AD4F3A3|nr:tetratricopeptide repeat protein [Nostoc sp. ChiQUE01b]MDZ8263957.1 tetratricopeptide repeat protein [Nostoc sp. ChiQUE01b]